MEIIYSILTLKGGECDVPFQSEYQLKSEIERLSGIYVPNQSYYCNGKCEYLLNILNQESNFQVISTERYSRFVIYTPGGRVKFYKTFFKIYKLRIFIMILKLNAKIKVEISYY